MKITFLGADHEVTGSCHYLSACGKNILIDCGMEQGNDVYENQELPINASDVDYVLLTHAHIDHSGLLPLLYVNGFRGNVFCTHPTVDLCDIMLRDSAHIQMFEAEWRNRKAKRSDLKEFIPLYDMEAAENVLKHFVGCEYDEEISVDQNIKIRFADAGHLLGSASIEVWVNEEGTEKKIIFSGDIGNLNKPLIKDPHYLKEADYVVMEATYGDKSHGGETDHVAELVKIFKRTFERGGNVIIPSFAVGRTQEILYYIRKIKAEKYLNDFDVYMDSPLAIEATSIFNKNHTCCFDEEAMELINQGINPITFPGLKFALESGESKNINFIKTPKVILSASGMCEAGRIRHHLKHNLWRPECTVLFVGYQANGTLGRAIVDGATEVKLFGETIQVKAEITSLQGSSGHADREGLINWLRALESKPEKVFVVHGEAGVCDEFIRYLQEEYQYDAVAPYTGAVYDLIDNVCLETGNSQQKARRNVEKRSQNMYYRLVAAGKRLLTVITHNEGGSNKDLAKFIDQLNALCDKWER